MTSIPLTLARDHARAIVRALDRALDRDLARVDDLEHFRALELDSVYGRALTLAHALDAGDLNLDHARDRALTLTHKLDHARDRTLKIQADRHHTRLARALQHSGDAAHSLRAVLDEWVTVEGRGADVGVRISAVAHRVTGWVVRVLPVEDRATYQEMFCSELHDLAQGEHPRRGQVRHAVAVMMRALTLRHELRAPAPQRERS